MIPYYEGLLAPLKQPNSELLDNYNSASSKVNNLNSLSKVTNLSQWQKVFRLRYAH